MQREKRNVRVYTEPQGWRHVGSALTKVEGRISHLKCKSSQRRPGPWVAGVSMQGANSFLVSGMGRW